MSHYPIGTHLRVVSQFEISRLTRGLRDAHSVRSSGTRIESAYVNSLILLNRAPEEGAAGTRLEGRPIMQTSVEHNFQIQTESLPGFGGGISIFTGYDPCFRRRAEHG